MPSHKLPPAVWPEGFNKSKLAPLYTQELYWLAHRICERCDALFAKHPADASTFYAAADVSSLELAFEALSDASKFRDLLFPSRDKPIYNDRAATLRDLLREVEYTALIDKKVRNTLEHFSEYLDDANHIHSIIPPAKLYAVAFNFVFSHLYPVNITLFPFPTFVSPFDGLTVFPIRVYVASTRMVHNFFWSIDMGALAEQARSVKATLGDHLGGGKPEDWVSGLITLGPPGA